MSASPGDVGTEIPDQGKSGEKRSWLTAQEFLAQVEAHRMAKLKERQHPRKDSGPRVVARDYQLDLNRKYESQPKVSPRPEAVP